MSEEFEEDPYPREIPQDDDDEPVAEIQWTRARLYMEQAMKAFDIGNPSAGLRDNINYHLKEALGALNP